MFCPKKRSWALNLGAKFYCLKALNLVWHFGYLVLMWHLFVLGLEAEPLEDQDHISTLNFFFLNLHFIAIVI